MDTIVPVPSVMAGIECHYCHGRFGGGDITRDHIVPKNSGGRDGKYNIVLSCRPCNAEKSNKWPTCTCPICQNAIAVHNGRISSPPVVVWSSVNDVRDDLKAMTTNFDVRCPNCGLITNDPTDCGWCRRAVRD